MNLSVPPEVGEMIDRERRHFDQAPAAFFHAWKYGVTIAGAECGQPRQLAYAIGCNPETTPFDEWYALAHHELGGDDMAERFDPSTDEVFQRIFHSKDDLTISITPNSMTLRAVTVRRGNL